MSEEFPYNGRLSRWEEIADGLAVVGVAPLAESFPFAPGQYATLGLLGDAGKLVQRPMSISSPASRLDEYEFFIRLVPGGAFTPLLWRRTVGDRINIKGPKGRFLLQDDGRACLFVASGTGLAPFMSMIETLLDEGRTREIHLLHGVSHEHDLAWRARLEALAADPRLQLSYAGTVSRPQHSPGWHGRIGRVEAILEAELERRGLHPGNATLYLCGNPEMIAAVDDIATRRGFAADQVRTELYWPKGRSHAPPADDEAEA